MASPSPAINRLRPRKGFTLYESLTAAVILALCMAALGDVFVARYQQADAVQQTGQALSLGRQLMDEIASKPLANPSSGSTTPAVAVVHTGTQPSTVNRSTFVAAGDYNGYADSGEAVYELDGTTSLAVTGTENFTRTVTVTQGAKPSSDVSSPSTDFSLVTVTVTTPSGRSIKLQRVISNYTFAR